MRRIATIVVSLGLVLGVAAFAMAWGGGGYGGHMMQPGYHMGYGGGYGMGPGMMGWGANDGEGWTMGPGMMARSGQGGWGPGSCPGWNGAYGPQNEAAPEGAPVPTPDGGATGR